MIRALLFASAIVAASPAHARAPACAAFDGALIVAEDGTFLGALSDEYDDKSIFNKFGTHGNRFAANSIWNKFGSYGSEFSTQSPMNQFSTQPPMLISNGKVIARLTKNKFLPGAVDPVILAVACFEYVPE